MSLTDGNFFNICITDRISNLAILLEKKVTDKQTELELELELEFLFSDPDLLLRQWRKNWSRPTHQHDVRITYITYNIIRY